MDLIYDAGYLRFRLSRPTDGEIVARHLDTYLGGDGWRRGLDGTAETLIRHALDFSLSSAPDAPRA
jgi:hypothetical protein